MSSDRKKYRLGEKIVLIHKDGTATEELGIAELNVRNGCLLFKADLTDSDIYNTAEKNNVKTWLTGDVIELFFQPRGRVDYYEFHVTPNEKTLQLHLPNAKEAVTLPFETMLFESHFQFHVQVEKDRNRWTAEMKIDLDILNCSEVYGSRITVCRHNYNRQWPKPEISVSSIFAGSVHSPDEWLVIEK